MYSNALIEDTSELIQLNSEVLGVINCYKYYNTCTSVMASKKASNGAVNARAFV